MSLLLALVAQGALSATPPESSAPLAPLANTAVVTATASALRALGPHPFGSARARVAADFVLSRFRESGFAQATVQEFRDDSGAGANVLALLPGRTDRLLVLAAHHDTGTESIDRGTDAGAVSALVGVANSLRSLRLAHTIVFGSFDGGRARGEGLRYYLRSLGAESRKVDAVIVIDSGSIESPNTLVLSAPSCGDESVRASRSLARSVFLEMTKGGAVVKLADPVLGLLVEPFARTFRARCPPNATAATDGSLAALLVSNRSFARSTGASTSAPPTGSDTETPSEEGLTGLVQGVERATRGADGAFREEGASWQSLGGFFAPALFLVLALVILNLPGAASAGKSDALRQALRYAYFGIVVFVAWRKPEGTLFMAALPSLVQPAWPRWTLGISLIPAALMVTLGCLGYVNGWVIGSFFTTADWVLLVGALLCMAFSIRSASMGSKASPTRKGKRQKK